MQVFPEKKCSRIGREAREFSAFSKTGKSGENLRKKRAGDKNPRPLKTGRGIEISGDEKIKFSPRGKKKKRKNLLRLFSASEREKKKKSLLRCGRGGGNAERIIVRFRADRRENREGYLPARPGRRFSVSWRWRASCPPPFLWYPAPPVIFSASFPKRR